MVAKAWKMGFERDGYVGSLSMRSALTRPECSGKDGMSRNRSEKDNACRSGERNRSKSIRNALFQLDFARFGHGGDAFCARFPTQISVVFGRSARSGA